MHVSWFYCSVIDLFIAFDFFYRSENYSAMKIGGALLCGTHSYVYALAHVFAAVLFASIENIAAIVSWNKNGALFVLFSVQIFVSFFFLTFPFVKYVYEHEFGGRGGIHSRGGVRVISSAMKDRRSGSCLSMEKVYRKEVTKERFNAIPRYRRDNRNVSRISQTRVPSHPCRARKKRGKAILPPKMKRTSLAMT